MARRSDLIEKRNGRIKDRFEAIQKQCPEWRYQAILDKLSDEFFLSSTYIQRIITDNV